MSRLKHRCGLVVLLGVLFSLLPLWDTHQAQAGQTRSSAELQALIRQTAAGGTLTLPEGTYRGPIVIDKPITVIGDGAVEIAGDHGKAPVIRVTASNVALRSLKIVQPSAAEQPAVLVTGNDGVFDKLAIETRSYGIVLREGGRHEIANTKIEGEAAFDSPEQAELSDKRNGIDLLNSHDNRIHHNRISRMNDGIYLESSHRNVVENNRVDHSRYGIHCMYTNKTAVRDNYGEFNVTGAMVMGVRDAEVSGNTFVKQSENVNSQGLLLFDVHTSRIRSNKVEGNRVGLYIEQSNRNEFEHNEVKQNFVGIQFLESNQNQFKQNQFVGNVIPAETSESSDNRFERNYWDAFRGIDTDGDGVSDIAYAMNPFFQRLTSQTPAFQLFFQSPGMQFLENMYSAGMDAWTTDTAPSMHPEGPEPETTKSAGQTSVLLLGLALFLSSVTLIMFMGVKRS